jgi:arsenite methyltransferase
MKSEAELKEIVRQKYSEIANQYAGFNAASCCGATVNSEEIYNIMAEDYNQLGGYSKDADLGLGCGLPTNFAQINEGDTVIDLGSGAGNDCFVARNECGISGKVIGIDFTNEMITKARQNAEKLGYNNVEFRFGDIENMPVSNNIADVVVSNCVLNLVPNKKNVINDIHRVLKPGGHFSISDIVLQGELPEKLLHDAEMYAGCVSGAIQKDTYLQFIKDAGFENITVQKEKAILIPKDILIKYLNEGEINDFLKGNTGIYSVTVFANKAGKKVEKTKINLAELNVCSPNSSCC